MKNISQLIYLTIFLILFVSCIFTIAELNIIAKSNYTNHLEQSVIMNASFFIICKLIVQSVFTYISANMLYLKIKDNHMEKDLIKSMDKISKWSNQPEKMIKVKEQQEPIIEKFNKRNDKPERNDKPDQDHFKSASDSNLLQFDPIDQINKYDKFGIDYNDNIILKYNRKGFIKDVVIGDNNNKSIESIKSNIDVVKDDGLVGELLSDILSRDHNHYSFRIDQIEDNKRWIKVDYDTQVLGNTFSSKFQLVKESDGRETWYKLME